MVNCVLCYADKGWTPRGLITLATALDANTELVLVTRKDTGGILRIISDQRAIRILDIDNIMGSQCLQTADFHDHPWLFRIPCINYLFNEGFDNVLSIDSDALVLGDISEIFREATSNGIAACGDMYSHLSHKQYLYKGQIIGNYCNVLACLKSSAGGQKLLTIMGVTDKQAHSGPYFNCGVLALSNSPVGRLICRRFISDIPVLGDVIKQTFWGDQDYLNVLMCRLGIVATVLEPLKYNFSDTSYPDKRIIHWAGAAKKNITNLWKPYLDNVIKPALSRIGVDYTRLITAISPDM